MASFFDTHRPGAPFLGVVRCVDCGFAWAGHPEAMRAAFGSVEVP